MQHWPRQRTPSCLELGNYYSEPRLREMRYRDLEKLRNALIRLIAYYEARATWLQKRFMKIIAAMEADAGRNVLSLILAESARRPQV